MRTKLDQHYIGNVAAAGFSFIAVGVFTMDAAAQEYQKLNMLCQQQASAVKVDQAKKAALKAHWAEILKKTAIYTCGHVASSVIYSAYNN